MTVAAIDAPASETKGAVALHLLRAGRVEILEGPVGESLLDPLQKAGLGLPAICGGKGACGTCRVHVPAHWRGRLAEPLKREVRLLAHVGASEGDRLACRILLEPDLDGLEIRICNTPEGDE